MRVFIALILLAAAFSLFFFWSRALRDDITRLSADKQSFESVIARINVLRKTRDSLLQSYNTISDEELKRIKNAMPVTPKTGNLVVQLANLASENNLLLKSINVAEQKLVGKQKKEKSNTVSVTFSVSGSYDNFIGFIKNLEQSLRIIDVADISFSAAGEKNIYDFNLSVKSYVLDSR